MDEHLTGSGKVAGQRRRFWELAAGQINNSSPTINGMSAEMIILVLLIATALAFDFTNGFHDTGNAMATSIATGALKPKVAVLLAGVLNLVGAFLSVEVAVTVTTSVLKVQDSKSGHLMPNITPSMG